MNIRELWRSFHGEQVPIAYVLRRQIPELWFRIYSLPDSKRYAEDESETHPMLRRYNMVAAEVFGEKERCLLFFPDYALRKSPSVFEAFGGELFCHFEDEDASITLFAAHTDWQSQKFDGIVRLVAEDEIRYFSLMNAGSGEILAPYDGGADLFLSSTGRRDALRAQFKDWLSRHPEGV